ncbi:hypothetical protein ACFFKH_08885 [Micromonospora marina]|uniref:Uncharacterized protein n=1 Tax=Micromonospora marina TaxID=307120 RepID=A0A1C4XI99_9ACTN|nr:hypothetical protein [Micromonospora marina]SCF08144.1 hypothetical protein GA0070215_107170 [Micromonospora marina]
MTDPTRAAIVRALADLWANGCLVPAPGHQERLAVVGVRRWRSVARRHRGRRLSHAAEEGMRLNQYVLRKLSAA